MADIAHLHLIILKLLRAEFMIMTISMHDVGIQLKITQKIIIFLLCFFYQTTKKEEYKLLGVRLGLCLKQALLC